MRGGRVVTSAALAPLSLGFDTRHGAWRITAGTTVLMVPAAAAEAMARRILGLEQTPAAVDAAAAARAVQAAIEGRTR